MWIGIIVIVSLFATVLGSKDSLNMDAVGSGSFLSLPNHSLVQDGENPQTLGEFYHKTRSLLDTPTVPDEMRAALKTAVDNVFKRSVRQSIPPNGFKISVKEEPVFEVASKEENVFEAASVESPMCWPDWFPDWMLNEEEQESRRAPVCHE